MAVLPTYRRQVIATGTQGGGNARSSVSPSSPLGQGLENVGRGLTGLAQQQAGATLDAMREQRQRVEDQAAVTVANTLSEGQVYWQQNFQERTQSWSPGQPDMREGINSDFDKWVSDTEQKLPTEASKRYFQQHAVGMKTRMLTGAYSYQEKATTDSLNAQTAAGIQADENVVYGDAAQFDAVYARRMEPMLARKDLDDAQKITRATEYRRKLALAAERGEMERDPAAWLEKRFGPAGGAAPATGGAGALDQSSPYNVVYGYGQYAKPDKPVTSMTLAEVEQYGAKLRDATAGQIGAGDKGTSAVGAYQILNPTRARYAEKLFGKDWRNVQYTPEVQDKLGRAIFEDSKNGNLQAVWTSLPDAKPGAYAKKSWEEMKGIIQSGESSPRGAPLLASTDGTDAGPLTMGERGTAGNPIATAPKTYSALDYEQQSALRQQAETKIRQGDARYKAGVTAQMRDAQAMHRDGIVDPVPMTEQQFARAFGEEGPRLYAEYQNSRLMGADIGSFKSMPVGDIAAVLERGRPQPGEGYAAADQRQTLRMQAAQQIQQQRNTDPAGYVVANTPELKGMQARIDAAQPADRPALTQRFVTDSLAEQARLGITQPRVLTPSQADSISQQAMSATRPEDSANLIGGLEAQYGQHFPRVFNELVAGKKIANELLIIPNLQTPAAREGVSRLARVKESDLVQGIDAKDQKTVKDLVTTNLEAMGATVPLLTEQSSEVMNAYETTMRKMAYSFMAGGQSPSDAVTRAQSLLLGQYQFAGSMRLPKAVDQSAAKQGAQSRLYDSLDGVDVPRDLVAGARQPEEVQQEWLRTVRARPLWFTNDDDSGVSLWAQGADGVRYRVTKGGAPVSFTWAELQLPTRTPTGAPQDMGRPAIGTGAGLRRQARQQ